MKNINLTEQILTTMQTITLTKSSFEFLICMAYNDGKIDTLEHKQKTNARYLEDFYLWYESEINPQEDNLPESKVNAQELIKDAQNASESQI